LGTLLGSLGFFRPTYFKAVRSVGYMFALAVLVFPLDAVMRATVDPNVNYFYLFNPEGADILVAAHNVLPVPFVYALVLVPIALGGTLTQAVLYKAVVAAVSRLRPDAAFSRVHGGELPP
jgi:hypothetical protein